MQNLSPWLEVATNAASTDGLILQQKWLCVDNHTEEGSQLRHSCIRKNGGKAKTIIHLPCIFRWSITAAQLERPYSYFRIPG